VRGDNAASMTSAISHPIGVRPPYEMTLRVYWEDTDAGGVVFYANYLKYFERARTEWLRALGFEQQRLQRDEGALFVVSEAQIRYHVPARLDDVLHVDVRLERAGRASLELRQSARRADGALLADGQVRLGCVDAARWQPRRLPDNLFAALNAA
jgi:acyl-CoA thioester hydrolase